MRQDCRAFQEQFTLSKKIASPLAFGSNGDDEDEDEENEEEQPKKEEEEEEEEEEPIWTAYGPDPGRGQPPAPDTAAGRSLHLTGGRGGPTA
jgi:hypothetical protein